MPKTREQIQAETVNRRLRVWKAYQEEKSQGLADDAALKQALILGIPEREPGWKSRPRQLELWKKHDLWPPPELSHADALRFRKPPLSEAELLRRAKEILMQDVTVAERPTTAPGRLSTLKTQMLAARFPVDLVEELEALGGRKSHHMEKALRLYLKLMKEEA